MDREKNKLFEKIVFFVAALACLFLAWHIIIAFDGPSENIVEAILAGLDTATRYPFRLYRTKSFSGAMLYTAFLLTLAYIYLFFLPKKTLFGREQGSAEWATKKDAKSLADKNPDNNMILSDEVQISMNTRQTRLNNNVLVVGGSGTGKTRFVGKPNALQPVCSEVNTDPKGELLKSTGKVKERQGYEVRVFNLIEKANSCCYNPFAYIHKESDVFKLINQLIKSTTPPEKNNSSADPFWEKSEIALLEAICFYLWLECPKEEQNFEMVMKLLLLASASEKHEKEESDLDIMFRQLAEEKGEAHIACKQYRIFKQAPAKTANSILISVGVRLSVFNMAEIAALTKTDNISLDTIGNKKTALYIVIPDSDTSFNFLVSMLYTQLFDELYFQADFGGETSWEDNQILFRSKENLVHKKRDLQSLVEQYQSIQGEKKKIDLHRQIRKKMRDIETEFGLPYPDIGQKIKNDVLREYFDTVDACLIRLNNKVGTLRSYIGEWRRLTVDCKRIKESKGDRSYKKRELMRLRERKKILVMRLDHEYGLSPRGMTEAGYFAQVKTYLKELEKYEAKYGSRQSLEDKMDKLNYLQSEGKKKKTEYREAAWWQKDLKERIKKEMISIKAEIELVNQIAAFEFGIKDLQKKQRQIKAGNGGRLPVHVRCILDEFANISPIPDFQKLVATMRSREISVMVILQNLSQLKEMYKDSWESITGNCDSFLFLGGQEQSTLEYVSKKLGKATIDKRSSSHSKGRNGSYSNSWDTLGRELMTPDEIGKMRDKCILFVRGFAPFLSPKYRLERHKYYSMMGVPDDPDDPNNYDFKSKFHTEAVSDEIDRRQFVNDEYQRLLNMKIAEALEKFKRQALLKNVSRKDLELLQSQSMLLEGDRDDKTEEIQKRMEMAVFRLLKQHPNMIEAVPREEIYRRIEGIGVPSEGGDDDGEEDEE